MLYTLAAMFAFFAMSNDSVFYDHLAHEFLDQRKTFLVVTSSFRQQDHIPASKMVVFIQLKRILLKPQKII